MVFLSFLPSNHHVGTCRAICWLNIYQIWQPSEEWFGSNSVYHRAQLTKLTVGLYGTEGGSNGLFKVSSQLRLFKDILEKTDLRRRKKTNKQTNSVRYAHAFPVIVLGLTFCKKKKKKKFLKQWDRHETSFSPNCHGFNFVS